MWSCTRPSLKNPYGGQMQITSSSGRISTFLWGFSSYPASKLLYPALLMIYSKDLSNIFKNSAAMNHIIKVDMGKLQQCSLGLLFHHPSSFHLFDTIFDLSWKSYWDIATCIFIFKVSDFPQIIFTLPIFPEASIAAF